MPDRRAGPAADSRVFVTTKGTRDIASGLLLISLLCLGVRRAVLSTFIFITTLIPLADFSERSRKYGLVRSRRTRAIMVGSRAYCFVVAFALICFVRTNQS
jgi:hypothetical protein